MLHITEHKARCRKKIFIAIHVRFTQTTEVTAFLSCTEATNDRSNTGDARYGEAILYLL
jgi:hypothetical protein